MSRLFLILVLSAAAAFVGCAVGPNYHQPAAVKTEPVPAAFTSPSVSTNGGNWKPAKPAAHLPRGSWWSVFDDPELDRLEELAGTNNQDLAATAARFEEARAQVRVARSELFPQVSLDPSFTRQRTSFNAPVKGLPAGTAYTYDVVSVPLDLGWEIDLWGRVRRRTEAAGARFTASADDLEAAKLAIQTELASDYFDLRAVDAERALVADTVQTYRRSLELTQNRRKGGIVSDLDVSQAETQLRATEAELPALDLQRADLLHAIATLCGRSAIDFQITSESPTNRYVPSVPLGLPSELLERRPDIAAAERRMAAANADVGVAIGAFYPSVQFNASAGFQSIDASSVFNWPSRMWSIGPSLSLPLFTGGRNKAQLAIARSAYDEAVANYRGIVLSAFQDVEDGLAAEHLLAAQLEAQSAALQAANQTLDIANNRYRAGLVTYIEVAIAQSAALQNERSVVQLRGQRLVAEVSLIRALGGGWRQD